jgi:hypothetical protein
MIRKFEFLLALAFAAVAAFAQEVKTIRCEFTSQPDGANVLVDDEMRGQTPLTLYNLGPGRHHVRFEKQNYESVDEFLSLKEGGMFQKNAVMNPVKGLLLLTSEPAGCDISLDGLSLGKTPRLITSLDAKNVYRILLQKPGYQSRTVEVKFSGRTPLVRHEELILDSGVIEVTSDPEGAEVTVNGQPRGTTPVTVRDVPKGRTTVTLKKHGFDEETREITMVAGDSQTLFVKMNGLPGTMSLSSVPDGARFYVNDQPHGKGPISLTNLKPGEYTIRVEKDGFATATKTVSLENGGAIVEEFRLENVMGRIEVRTIPAGAQVLLDGSVVGTTKSKDSDAEASDVFAIENVREGEHTILVRCDGYADVTKHPIVENQKTQSLNIRLKRVFTPDVEIVTDSGTYRGVLISKTPTGVEVEVSLGINRTFQHSEIRKLNFLK